MMRNSHFCRVKSLLLSIVTFSFVFALILRVMIHQINISDQTKFHPVSQSDTHGVKHGVTVNGKGDKVKGRRHETDPVHKAAYLENDFDKLKHAKTAVPAETIQHVRKNKLTFLTHHEPKDNDRNVFIDIVVERIFWSPQVEKLIPKGISNYSSLEWIRGMRRTPVRSLQPPSYGTRCGRAKNGYVVMESGVPVCARYRHPQDNLVLGEVMSFYLSLLLGMDNVPAVVLSLVNPNSTHWAGHTRNVTMLGWEENKFVALIRWIDDLRATVKMPKIVLEAYRTGNTVTSHTITWTSLSAESLAQTAQWGTMVIFDYLTGNYDRVAHMQDVAEIRNLSNYIEGNIHNLLKTPKGKLWLIDNESGLLDSYSVLHRGANSGRYQRYHQDMLQTMCIFQKSVINSLNKLHISADPSQVLEHYVRMHEPLFDVFQKDKSYKLFKTQFAKRTDSVIQWINVCKDSQEM